jgi:hypothetical protein
VCNQKSANDREFGDIPHLYLARYLYFFMIEALVRSGSVGYLPRWVGVLLLLFSLCVCAVFKNSVMNFAGA